MFTIIAAGMGMGILGQLQVVDQGFMLTLTSLPPLALMFVGSNPGCHMHQKEISAIDLENGILGCS